MLQAEIFLQMLFQAKTALEGAIQLEITKYQIYHLIMIIIIDNQKNFREKIVLSAKDLIKV
jgi:hypothetical protein